jgi:signal transduction histidine kinase
MRPRFGKGVDDPIAILSEEAPLSRKLKQEGAALLLDRRPDDFEYIPIYAENKLWLDATASQIVAPLLDENQLIGLVGLERRHKDDPFTFEDVALLDSITVHLAAGLRSVQLAEDLAESREVELLSGWSNMILHDLKNYLGPMRMISQNIIARKNKPNSAEIIAADVTRVADRMEALVKTLSDFKGAAACKSEEVDVNDLVETTLSEMQIDRRSSVDLVLSLRAQSGVIGDGSLLKRVLENLVTNAVEAMNGEGALAVSTEDHVTPGDGTPSVFLSVEDTGVGMSESFLREKLFKPFETTKQRGLGLGLCQCRSIIRAHGGQLKVQSTPGVGTIMQVRLGSSSATAADDQPKRARVAKGGLLS